MTGPVGDVLPDDAAHEVRQRQPALVGDLLEFVLLFAPKGDHGRLRLVGHSGTLWAGVYTVSSEWLVTTGGCLGKSSEWSAAKSKNAPMNERDATAEAIDTLGAVMRGVRRVTAGELLDLAVFLSIDAGILFRALARI